MNNRKLEIIEYLKRYDDYITVSHLSSLFNVTSRTIHNDISNMDKLLKERGMQLKTVRGKGIKIKFNSDHKECSVKNNRNLQDRKIEIIKKLLFSEETITYDHLSEEFLTSKSSIKKDMEIVDSILTANNKMQIISDTKGTRLKGNESDFQRAHINFNNYIFKVNEFYKENSHIEILENYYGKLLVQQVTKVLYSHFKRNTSTMIDHYLFNLLSTLVILIYRLMKNKNSEIYYLKDEQSVDEESLYNAKKILECLRKKLLFNYQKEDVNFLSRNLIYNKFESAQPNKEDIYIVDSLINKVSDFFDVNLYQSDNLRGNLFSHFPPMVYRLENNVYINNPFIKQVKLELPTLFNLIWMSLEDELEDINLNEEEVGFITIHFQAALENVRNNQKILILCPTGMATTELLVNQIANILPSYFSIETSSLRELKSKDLNIYKMIISTFELEDNSIEYTLVSPLLTDQEKINITKKLNNIYIENDIAKLEDIYNLDISVETFNTNFSNKRELLETIIQNTNTHLDKKNFIESLLKREDLGPTDLPTGSAIPHGNPEYVHENKLIIVHNKTYLKWNEYKVRLIFIPCIKNLNEYKGLFSKIYNIVKSKESTNKLLDKLSYEKR